MNGRRFRSVSTTKPPKGAISGAARADVTRQTRTAAAHPHVMHAGGRRNAATQSAHALCSGRYAGSADLAFCLTLSLSCGNSIIRNFFLCRCQVCQSVHSILRQNNSAQSARHSRTDEALAVLKEPRNGERERILIR